MSFENDKLLNLMRSQAAGVLSLFSHLRVGQISSYDENTYRAQVIIQPEGIKTGWLPILTPWMGNGWGFYSPPAQGDTVVIHCMEGSLTAGFVGERIFTSVELPITTPTGVPSGEAWMVHKTGTFIKFHNDGTIEIKALDGSGNPTNINIAANLVITGNITATGNILDTSGTNAHTIANMRTIFNAHVHQGVTTGPSNSGASTTTQ